MSRISFGVAATVRDKDGNAVLDGDGKKQTVGGDVTYDFGKDVKEAVEKFGDLVVFSNYVAQGTVRVQSVARTAFAGGDSIEEAQKKVDAYILGAAPARSKKDYTDVYKRQFEAASGEEQEQMLKELRASITKK